MIKMFNIFCNYFLKRGYFVIDFFRINEIMDQIYRIITLIPSPEILYSSLSYLVILLVSKIDLFPLNIYSKNNNKHDDQLFMDFFRNIFDGYYASFKGVTLSKNQVDRCTNEVNDVFFFKVFNKKSLPKYKPFLGFIYRGQQACWNLIDYENPYLIISSMIYLRHLRTLSDAWFNVLEYGINIKKIIKKELNRVEKLKNGLNCYMHKDSIWSLNNWIQHLKEYENEIIEKIIESIQYYQFTKDEFNHLISHIRELYDEYDFESDLLVDSIKNTLFKDSLESDVLKPKIGSIGIINLNVYQMIDQNNWAQFYLYCLDKKISQQNIFKVLYDFPGHIFWVNIFTSHLNLFKDKDIQVALDGMFITWLNSPIIDKQTWSVIRLYRNPNELKKIMIDKMNIFNIIRVVQKSAYIDPYDNILVFFTKKYLNEWLQSNQWMDREALEALVFIIKNNCEKFKNYNELKFLMDLHLIMLSDEPIGSTMVKLIDALDKLNQSTFVSILKINIERCIVNKIILYITNYQRIFTVNSDKEREKIMTYLKYNPSKRNMAVLSVMEKPKIIKTLYFDVMAEGISDSDLNRFYQVGLLSLKQFEEIKSYRSLEVMSNKYLNIFTKVFTGDNKKQDISLWLNVANNMVNFSNNKDFFEEKVGEIRQRSFQ